ncbi:MAG: factor-independent urate hydroxylase [Gaiellaceae bacterium]
MKTRYGKDDVSVYRTDGVRTLRGTTVRVDVFGESFEASYTEGDNSKVVATDTMKNVIHSAALDYAGESLEGLAQHLGVTFLGLYGDMETLNLRVAELPFIRHSDVLFQRIDRDYGVAEISIDRTGVSEHRSGREGLHLVKITGSAFASFARDEHTTLPEFHDRPLFVYLDVYWRHVDFAKHIPSEDVRDSLLATFDAFVSLSIQQLVHEMGQRVFAEFDEIIEISFEAQNRLWDTAQVSADDDRVKVYTDPRPPIGRIGLTLNR